MMIPCLVMSPRRSISISDDLEELKQQAICWLPPGEDKSKGWKLLHPLHKLRAFKNAMQYCRPPVAQATTASNHGAAPALTDNFDDFDRLLAGMSDSELNMR